MNLVIRNTLVFTKKLQIFVESQSSSFGSYWKERKKNKLLKC